MLRTVKLILILFSSGIVSLYIYLGSFSQLMADDFCSVYYSERLGVLRSVWYWYISWHGGYSASFADGLLGLFGRTGIGFVTPLALLIWVLSLTWFVFAALKYFGFDRQMLISLAASLLVITATLIGSPNPSASVVWWGGLRGYIPPLILFPLYLSMFFFLAQSTAFSKTFVYWCIASFLSVLMIGGFSEPFTPLLLILLSLLLILEVIKYRKAWIRPSSIFLSAGLLGGILALALMVLAPGNAERQAFSPPPPAPMGILSIAARFYFEFLYGILLSPVKTGIFIGVFFGSLSIGALLSGRLAFRLRHVVIAILAGLFFAFCCFPPAAFGQSTAPSDSSLITPVYFLVWGVICSGFMSGQILANFVLLRGATPQVVLCTVLVLSLGYSMGAKAVDLAREIQLATTYASEWDLRDQQITQALLVGKNEVYVNPIPHWITYEPNDNPKFFVNECMSLYYKINIVSSADAND